MSAKDRIIVLQPQLYVKDVTGSARQGSGDRRAVGLSVNGGMQADGVPGVGAL